MIRIERLIVIFLLLAFIGLYTVLIYKSKNTKNIIAKDLIVETGKVAKDIKKEIDDYNP